MTCCKKCQNPITRARLLREARTKKTITGTIFGQQSVAELILLLQQFDNDISGLQQKSDQIDLQWKQSNSHEETDWQNDFTNLKNRYSSAHARADRLIAITPSWETAYEPADDEYLQVLQAFDQNATSTSGQTGSQAKGDFGDLYDRLQIASNRYGAGPVPQVVVDPNQVPDVDLNTLNTLDKGPVSWLTPRNLAIAGVVILAVLLLGQYRWLHTVAVPA